MKKIYFLFAMLLMASMVATAAPRKAASRKYASSVQTPVTLPATDVTATGFTANWKAVPNAAVYQVTCYEPITVEEDGEYVILEEGFNYVDVGTSVEPYFPDESFINFADYEWTDTPDWQGWWPVFAQGMVSGIIYSPYMALENNDGKFTLNIDIQGYAGAMFKVVCYGSKEVEKDLYLTENGLNKFSVEFDCGTHDTFFRFVEYGIVDDPDMEYADKWDFIDNIQVVQELKAGDTFLRLIELYETDEDSYETSHRFDNMQFLYGASHLAYDVMAMVVVYNDPWDDWDYDVYYSDYSPLEHVTLTSSVEAIETESTEPVEYFNLQGQRVNGTLTPGIYIRRQGESTSKIYVK